jgi:hypothetical protein
MRRAGIAALIGALVVLLPVRRAHAFHSGATFDKPAGGGGGGSIFYTGANREHRWNCAACHEDAPRQMRVRLNVVPAELFSSFKYQPGTTYAFTATMENESRGRQSARANYNSLALSAEAASGAPAGDFNGYAAEDFFAGPATIVSAGQKVGVTSWTFSWTAPDPGAGTVTLCLGAVDGNAAGQAGDSTSTDAFGDDVFVARVELGELGAKTELVRPPPAPHGAPFRSPLWFALASGAVAVVIVPLRRRSRRTP